MAATGGSGRWVLLGLATALVLWLVFWRTEPDQIADVVTRIAVICRRADGEGERELGRRLDQDLRLLMASEVVVELADRVGRAEGPDAALALATQSLQEVTFARVELGTLNVSRDQVGWEATVQVLATVVYDSPERGRVTEVRPVRMRLRRADDRWLLTRLEAGAPRHDEPEARP